MEWLRVSKDAWGQEVLEGVSWDLLPWFFWAAVVMIVVHALFYWVMSRRSGQAKDD